VSREKDWTGTATHLLEALGDLVTEEAKKAKHWPKNARALSGMLKRLIPAFRKIGISIEGEPRTSGERTRRVSEVPGSSVTSVTSVTTETQVTAQEWLGASFGRAETPSFASPLSHTNEDVASPSPEGDASVTEDDAE